MTENDFGLGLVEKARRVLPGGTFGNFPGDVVIREAVAAGCGTRAARSMSTPARFVAAVPCADQVRFVSTGSETDLYAIKLVFYPAGSAHAQLPAKLERCAHSQSSNNVTEQHRPGCDDPYREGSDGSGPEAIGPVLRMP